MLFNFFVRFYWIEFYIVLNIGISFIVKEGFFKGKGDSFRTRNKSKDLCHSKVDMLLRGGDAHNMKLGNTITEN